MTNQSTTLNSVTSSVSVTCSKIPVYKLEFPFPPSKRAHLIQILEGVGFQESHQSVIKIIPIGFKEKPEDAWEFLKNQPLTGIPYGKTYKANRVEEFEKLGYGYIQVIVTSNGSPTSAILERVANKLQSEIEACLKS